MLKEDISQPWILILKEEALAKWETYCEFQFDRDIEPSKVEEILGEVLEEILAIDNPYLYPKFTGNVKSKKYEHRKAIVGTRKTFQYYIIIQLDKRRRIMSVVDIRSTRQG